LLLSRLLSPLKQHLCILLAPEMIAEAAGLHGEAVAALYQALCLAGLQHAPDQGHEPVQLSRS
jgi:hypothetical protein